MATVNPWPAHVGGDIGGRSVCLGLKRFDEIEFTRRQCLNICVNKDWRRAHTSATICVIPRSAQQRSPPIYMCTCVARTFADGISCSRVVSSAHPHLHTGSHMQAAHSPAQPSRGAKPMPASQRASYIEAHALESGDHSCEGRLIAGPMHIPAASGLGTSNSEMMPCRLPSTAIASAVWPLNTHKHTHTQPFTQPQQSSRTSPPQTRAHTSNGTSLT